MDGPLQVFIEFSPDIKQQLGPVDLQAILDEAGIAAETQWAELPPTHPDERGKALVETVLIAAVAGVSLAAAMKALESALTHYLDHKAVRDSHFVYWANEPMLDGEGRPVLDTQGQPRKIRRRQSGFDPYPEIPAEGITISVTGKGASVSTRQPAGSKGKEPKKD